jgi:hypothetical protein
LIENWEIVGNDLSFIDLLEIKELFFENHYRSLRGLREGARPHGKRNQEGAKAEHTDSAPKFVPKICFLHERTFLGFDVSSSLSIFR